MYVYEKQKVSVPPFFLVTRLNHWLTEVCIAWLERIKPDKSVQTNSLMGSTQGERRQCCGSCFWIVCFQDIWLVLILVDFIGGWQKTKWCALLLSNDTENLIGYEIRRILTLSTQSATFLFNLTLHFVKSVSWEMFSSVLKVVDDWRA